MPRSTVLPSANTASRPNPAPLLFAAGLRYPEAKTPTTLPASAVRSALYERRTSSLPAAVISKI